jgi:hypothetical protein
MHIQYTIKKAYLIYKQNSFLVNALQRTFPPSRKKQDPNDREQLEKREA